MLSERSKIEADMIDIYPDELKFCYWGNPILRKKAIDIVDPNSAELASFIEKFLMKLEEHNGAGLSANQVGCDRNLCLVCFPRKDDYSEPKVLINPRIVQKSKELVVNEEGCLSFPKLYLDISRPEWIDVEAYIYGEGNVAFRAEKTLARIICHEVDHLNGVLFIDHISQLKRTLIKKELKKISQEFNR